MFLFGCVPISYFNLCIYHLCYFAGIMTQAGADMSAFRLARTNRIAVSGGPSLNPPLNQTPGPRDALADVVPPPCKDPKGKHKHKKRSHCDHRSGSGEASDHKEGSSREKILKQKMLEF